MQWGSKTHTGPFLTAALFSYSLLITGARITNGYDYHRTLYTQRPTRPYKPPTRLPMGPLGAPPTRPLGDPYLHAQRLRRHDYQRTLQDGVLRDFRDGSMGPFPTVSDGTHRAPMGRLWGAYGDPSVPSRTPFPTVSDDPFPSMTMSLCPSLPHLHEGSHLFGHPRNPLTISGLIT